MSVKGSSQGYIFFNKQRKDRILDLLDLFCHKRSCKPSFFVGLVTEEHPAGQRRREMAIKNVTADKENPISLYLL